MARTPRKNVAANSLVLLPAAGFPQVVDLIDLPPLRHCRLFRNKAEIKRANVAPTISAREGTLARKREIRTFLEFSAKARQNSIHCAVFILIIFSISQDSNGDDAFDATPFRDHPKVRVPSSEQCADGDAGTCDTPHLRSKSVFANFLRTENVKVFLCRKQVVSSPEFDSPGLLKVGSACCIPIHELTYALQKVDRQAMDSYVERSRKFVWQCGYA